MTPDANGWYKYTFTGVTSINVIFRNEAGNIQSKDLTGITVDTWFDSSYNPVLSVNNENLPKEDFIIYPNPTYGTVKIASKIVIDEVGIFDIKGCLISFQSINNNQEIEMGGIAPGTYLLK